MDPMRGGEVPHTHPQSASLSASYLHLHVGARRDIHREGGGHLREKGKALKMAFPVFDIPSSTHQWQISILGTVWTLDSLNPAGPSRPGGRSFSPTTRRKTTIHVDSRSLTGLQVEPPLPPSHFVLEISIGLNTQNHFSARFGNPLGLVHRPCYSTGYLSQPFRYWSSV